MSEESNDVILKTPSGLLVATEDRAPDFIKEVNQSRDPFKRLGDISEGSDQAEWVDR